jgi:apolipoprotein N-acyltransferase
VARRAARVCWTGLSAAIYASAFPPFGLWPLAWVALVPLLYALRSAAFAERVGLGVLWSLLAGWGVGTWMPGAVAHYFDQPWIVGLGLFLVVAGGMAAPYYALFAAVAPRLGRIGGFASPLLLGASWATVELARGRLLNGDWLYIGNSPWATLGYSQSDVLPVIQVASLGGVYAVSFVVATANGAVAQLLGAMGPRDGRGLVAALAVVLATLGYGFMSLGTKDPATSPVTIALVQPALDAASRWQAGGEARSLDAYLRLTRDRLADERVQMVLWPEAALPLFLEEETLYRRGIGAVMDDLGAELVVGAMARQGERNQEYTNSAFLLGPEGSVVARYDKLYLLPFMEYFPLRMDFLRRNFGRAREFSPGVPSPPLPTRAGPAAVLLCNEAYLPHVARRRVLEGARWLINPSSDGWVPDAGFAEHQFQIAALRAVETRTPLARISDTGPSAVVDAWGRVSGKTPALAEAVTTATLVPGPADSLYLKLGDTPGLVCAAVVLIALIRPGLFATAPRRGRGP